MVVIFEMVYESIFLMEENIKIIAKIVNNIVLEK